MPADQDGVSTSTLLPKKITPKLLEEAKQCIGMTNPGRGHKGMEKEERNALDRQYHRYIKWNEPANSRYIGAATMEAVKKRLEDDATAGSSRGGAGGEGSGSGQGAAADRKGGSEGEGGGGGGGGGGGKFEGGAGGERTGTGRGEVVGKKGVREDEGADF